MESVEVSKSLINMKNKLPKIIKDLTLVIDHYRSINHPVSLQLTQCLVDLNECLESAYVPGIQENHLDTLTYVGNQYTIS